MTTDMHLTEVTFNALEFAGWVKGAPRNLPESFCGVIQDTRHLKPGMLYVALRGEHFNGHDFVRQALAAGAAAALVDQSMEGYPGAESWPLIRVADTRRALLEGAGAWRASSGAKIVAITGSSGKTTTKEMTAAICAAGGRVCRTRGNLNNDIGLPLSILAMPPDCDFGVFELGTNHPGEIALLAETLHPDVGVISSIGSAHIENFGSTEAIAAEKGALLQHLSASGCAVLSREMLHFRQVERRCGVPVVTVSLLDKNADYYGEIRDLMGGRVRIIERDTGAGVELHSGVPGRYNIYNLMLAFAAARRAGVPAESAQAALEKLVIPGMRWQMVETTGGIRFINDAYNANAESMKAVLELFSEVECAGRKVVVLGDMLELGGFAESLHSGVGATAAAVDPDLLCLVGPLAGRFAAEGALRAGLAPAKVLCCTDAAEAGRRLADRLRRGDLVLLKASRGMHLEEVLDEF